MSSPVIKTIVKGQLSIIAVLAVIIVFLAIDAELNEPEQNQTQEQTND